jgi:hypothetical protein
MCIRAYKIGPTTDAKPGNYALGSPQSRAAARAVLAQRLAGRKRVELIVSWPIPRPDGERIRIGEWRECREMGRPHAQVSSRRG